jgi:hypothetical protein
MARSTISFFVHLKLPLKIIASERIGHEPSQTHITPGNLTLTKFVPHKNMLQAIQFLIPSDEPDHTPRHFRIEPTRAVRADNRILFQQCSRFGHHGCPSVGAVAYHPANSADEAARFQVSNSDHKWPKRRAIHVVCVYDLEVKPGLIEPR